MRILLANHHLADRAGSELYTYELASAFKDAGHEPAVFTFVVGSVAQQLVRAGIPFFDPGTPTARIEEFAPQILHVHHAPCLYYLGSLKLECPVVFSSLGKLPGLEAPPLVWPGVGHWLAISEEVRDFYAQTAFVKEVPSSILRNWFDDRGMQRPPVRRRKGLRTWAVITNHLAPELRVQLDALAARSTSFTWEHFGAPNRSVEITPELLEPFDGVISIGRTVLLAAALGKACLVHDIYGSDGLLTTDKLSELSSVNFSGRLRGHSPTPAELEALLMDDALQVDLEAVQESVWSGFRLTGRRDELLGRYQQLIAAGPRLDQTSRTAYGRAGIAHAEALGTVSRSQAAELGRFRTALEDALSNIRRLQSENDSLRTETEDFRTSLAWRAVHGLRQLKDYAVPEGSGARRIYDRARNAVKGLPRQGS